MTTPENSECYGEVDAVAEAAATDRLERRGHVDDGRAVGMHALAVAVGVVSAEPSEAFVNRVEDKRNRISEPFGSQHFVVVLNNPALAEVESLAQQKASHRGDDEVVDGWNLVERLDAVFPEKG